MGATRQIKKKGLDLKSFLIGFLLATTLFFGLGSSFGSGTQDVRIVGVSTYDNLRVKIDRIGSSVEMPVKIGSINSSSTIPVKISDIDYSVELPIKIKDQPLEVKLK